MEGAFRLGQLVESAAGRDRGNRFLVVGRRQDGYWQVADGHRRSATRPKPKNPRHLLGHSGIDLQLEARLGRGEAVSDQEIAQSLARLLHREEEMKAGWQKKT